jgi:cell division septal protein FtsQ
MWFKREHKNRNRRTGRGHVLDVKLRSNQVRAMRLRLASIASAVVFGTVLGLYLIWRTGEFALNRFVYENPDFAIQTVEVQTDGVISPDELRRWSGVRIGSNLIALDLAAVKRNLALASVISAVSIERVLPHTLKIRVSERTPVAQVNVPLTDAAGGIALSVYQLDAGGNVMRPLDPRERTIPVLQMDTQLPVITGLDFSQLQPGRCVDSSPTQAALRLIATFRHSPMAGLVDLRRVDISAPAVIVVTTGQGGQITFSLDNLEQQLRRWRGIYDWGAQRGKVIASVDLAVENNVPVNWVVANAAPVATPAKVKPGKNRRTNV